MEKEKELLPIGSVVQLEDSTALVMISGFLPVTSNPEKIWDYSGFRYPIGYTDDDSIFCFDQSQIQIVYAYGYRDIEHDIFMSELGSRLNSYIQRIQEMKKTAEQTAEAPMNDVED